MAGSCWALTRDQLNHALTGILRAYGDREKHAVSVTVFSGKRERLCVRFVEPYLHWA